MPITDRSAEPNFHLGDTAVLNEQLVKIISVGYLDPQEPRTHTARIIPFRDVPVQAKYVYAAVLPRGDIVERVPEYELETVLEAVGIRPSKRSDFSQILSLHRLAFGDIADAVDYLNPSSRPTFEDSCFGHYDDMNILVASIGDDIVGMATYTFLEQGEDRKTFLTSVLDPKKRPGLNRTLRAQSEKLGYEDIALEYYNEVYATEALTNMDSAIYLVTLAVDPRVQRQGLATRLFERSIYIGREAGKTLALVECIEDTGSEKLLIKKGFHPIARYGPMYPEGLCDVLMGKSIET